jgi:anti-anti-sigma factor
MKLHLTSSTKRRQADDRDATHPALTNRSGAGAPAHARPHLTLVPPQQWSHTLILRGDLDQHSAPELEDEIDCLHQEGVTALTLDLRQLNVIDSRGAQVIASQSASFKRGGRCLAVLVGSPAMYHALTTAGWTDPTTSAPIQRTLRRFSVPSSLRVTPDLTTTTIRDLGPTGASDPRRSLEMHTPGGTDEDSRSANAGGPR